VKSLNPYFGSDGSPVNRSQQQPADFRAARFAVEALQGVACDTAGCQTKRVSASMTSFLLRSDVSFNGSVIVAIRDLWEQTRLRSGRVPLLLPGTPNLNGN
jgi:hypothetical protein